MGPEGPRCAAGRLSGVQVAVLVQGAHPREGFAVIDGILDRLRRTERTGNRSESGMSEFERIDDEGTVITGWTEAPAGLNGSAGASASADTGTHGPTWASVPEPEVPDVEDAIEAWGLGYSLGRAVVLVAGCADSDDPAGDLDAACALLQKAKRRLGQ